MLPCLVPLPEPYISQKLMMDKNVVKNLTFVPISNRKKDLDNAGGQQRLTTAFSNSAEGSDRIDLEIRASTRNAQENGLTFLEPILETTLSP